MNPTFTVKLGQQVLSGLVVTGKFDGKIPSLACATTGGKILLHSPHDVGADGQTNALRYLNLNRKISAIASGSLSTPNGNGEPVSDLIFVGTQSNLLAYDVERNADSFFVDIQDGVNALVVGTSGNSTKPLVIAGGNCSVLGFDSKGTEAFWTVTGDNVSSLAICESGDSKEPVLLVGSEDFEIRVFRNEEMIGEISEADRVAQLATVRGSKFAYGLSNGTVGIYSNAKNRLWRVKTKNRPTALLAYDLDLDGVPELFSGWSHGAYNVRREDNGEVVFRSTMDAAVAAMVSADYRLDGKEEVMICSEAGEIRAYVAADAELGEMFESGVGKDNMSDQKALAELQAQKLELLAELKILEKSNKSTKSTDVPVGALPPNTSLTYKLEPDESSASVALRVILNTDAQIVNLIAVDLEGVVLVDREVVAVSPRSQSKTAFLPLRPTKNVPCSIRVQTHVASRSLVAQLHVFETDIVLPKFSAFKQITPDGSYYPEAPNGGVSFLLLESAERVLEWLQKSFIIAHELKKTSKSIEACFVSVCNTLTQQNRTNDPNGISLNRNFEDKHVPQVLIISLSRQTDGGQSSLQVEVLCDSMELAAEVVQDIAKYFKISELASEADFPAEFQLFEEVVSQVTECNETRQRLQADMADDTQRIKALVIRAEDSRLMVDMDSMRKSYTELNSMNNQLLGGYSIRQQNHERLLSSLKEVNQMIQKAANLRVGNSKTRVITDCRGAVKVNNMKSLFRIISKGFEPNSSISAQSK